MIADHRRAAQELEGEPLGEQLAPLVRPEELVGEQLAVPSPKAAGTPSAPNAAAAST